MDIVVDSGNDRTARILVVVVPLQLHQLGEHVVLHLTLNRTPGIEEE